MLAHVKDVKIDTLFLDTTYAHKKYKFGAQEEMIRYISDVILSKLADKKTLFLISTYNIGKEKILMQVADSSCCSHTRQVARDSGETIFVSEKKLQNYEDCNLDCDLRGTFTGDASSSRVHVTDWSALGETWPYFRPNYTNMRSLLEEAGEYTHAVGFVPTGWMYATKQGPKVISKDNLELHLVPYRCSPTETS